MSERDAEGCSSVTTLTVADADAVDEDVVADAITKKASLTQSITDG